MFSVIYGTRFILVPTQPALCASWMPVSSFEHIYKDTNLAQSVLTRAGRWNCATETIEAAVAALGGGTDKVPEHQSGEASSDLEPPSEVFSEAPEMEADDFEEASFYAGGLGSIVRVDSSSNLPVVFRHRSSRVVHISREDHPDDEGEMSVLVCGRVANANYERLDELPAVILSKRSSCWAGR